MYDQASTFSHVRAARPEEAALLSALAFRSKQYWDYSDEFMENCRQELTYSPEELAQGFAYVAEQKNEIAGFYVLTSIDDEQIELEALFIEPKYIHQGFGRLLMRHAMQQAFDAGYKSMIIQSDPYAENFYYSAGAVKIGERQSDSIAGRFLPLLRIDLVDPALLNLSGFESRTEKKKYGSSGV